jgi:hypothetical protein
MLGQVQVLGGSWVYHHDTDTEVIWRCCWFATVAGVLPQNITKITCLIVVYAYVVLQAAVSSISRLHQQLRVTPLPDYCARYTTLLRCRTDGLVAAHAPAVIVTSADCCCRAVCDVSPGVG